MTFYENMAAVALRLITDKGQSLPIRRISKTFDPVTSTTSAATKVTGTIKTVIVPFNKDDKANMDNRLAESLAKGRLRKLIVAASGLTFAPEPMDVIDFESGQWQVEGVTPISPAGTPLVYFLIVKKGILSAVDAAAT